MNALVFLDCETTGLDPDRHEVWEIAYAIDDSLICSFIVPHTLRTADLKALELNRYWERYPKGAQTDFVGVDVSIREDLAGATIVGANPAFDTAFLRARWGVSPWHHRLIDVESMALTVLGYDRPKGLHALAADLRERGHEIPAPDHSAAADVATTRAVFHALRFEDS